MKITNDFFKKYYVIKYNDIIVASGNFKFIKNKKAQSKNVPICPDNCISLENKYFFNTGSKKFKIENVNYAKNFILQQKELKKYFQIELWKNCHLKSNIDIFIENTINQLDEQVIPLVTAINKLTDTETTGSCSGHNIHKPYIDIKFESLYSLHCFLILLQSSKLNEKMVLQSNYTINNDMISDYNGIILRLTTIETIGNQAYQLFNRFAEIINLRSLV